MFTTEGNLGDYCKTTAFDHKGNTIVMYWWLSHSFEFYMIYVLLGTSIFTCTYIQQWNVSFEAFICQSYSRWPCKVLWKLRSHRRICQPTPLRICSQNRMMVMMEVKTMMKHATNIWWISNEYLSDILCFGLSTSKCWVEDSFAGGLFRNFPVSPDPSVQWDSSIFTISQRSLLYVLRFYVQH